MVEWAGESQAHCCSGSPGAAQMAPGHTQQQQRPQREHCSVSLAPRSLNTRSDDRPLHLRPGHRGRGGHAECLGCTVGDGSAGTHLVRHARGHFPGQCSQWKEDSFFLYVENHVACNKRQFCFFFSNLYDFSFSCLIAMPRTSNTVLNKKGESKHPCFVLEIRVNALSLSLLNTKFDYRIYEAEEVPLNS